jgi:hypothetical protein
MFGLILSTLDRHFFHEVFPRQADKVPVVTLKGRSSVGR